MKETLYQKSKPKQSKRVFSRGVLSVLLAFVILVSVVIAPGMVEAKPRDEHNSLKVVAPPTVFNNEEFTITVYQKVENEENHSENESLLPVEGAKVYALPQYGRLGDFQDDALVKTSRSSQLSDETADQFLLGTTDASGNVKVSIQNSGKYVLKAEKEVVPADQTEKETLTLTGFANILVMQKENKVIFTADKHVYKQGETVSLTVYNQTDKSITLSSAAPWTITMPNGSKVYSPVSAQAVVELKPGESKAWTWDQKTNDGTQAKPGVYLAILSTSEGKYLTQFNISGLRFEKGKTNKEPSFSGPNPFKDVTGQVKWGDPHILKLYQLKIVKGRTPDSFVPDGTLTRAEFLALLLRAMGEDPLADTSAQTTQTTQGDSTGSGTTSQALPFADVSPQHWAYPYILRAWQLGIITDKEYPNGFGPDVPINRLEICVMAMRAMGLENEATQQTGQTLAFKDREQVDFRYQGYVKTAVDWGIILGFDDNTFRPNEKATRRQACVIIYRMLQDVNGDQSQDSQ